MGTDLRELLRAGPGPVDLTAVDPRGTPGVPDGQGKAWGRAELAELGTELARQQEMLYAQCQVAASGTPAARRRVLLVLQGMDCSGKGGTVRNVAGQMNPIGVRVAAFGPPTQEELSHQFGDASEPNRDDFLWRIRKALPPYGQVGVFDRSHYEDVLIVRVRSLVPESVWRRRYDVINQWEDELVDDGVAVVKVMLHLSYQEQSRRLAARLDNPIKHWKFNPGDIDERELWQDYQAAYAEVLAQCHTYTAPWYVVPADRKWYRNWAVARLMLATFQDLALSYPAADFDVDKQRERLARSADERR